MYVLYTCYGVLTMIDPIWLLCKENCVHMCRRSQSIHTPLCSVVETCFCFSGLSHWMSEKDSSLICLWSCILITLDVKFCEVSQECFHFFFFFFK